MKKLLNTLYVTKEKAYLTLEGETVCVEENGRRIAQFPLINFESIVLFSWSGASPSLMGKCVELGINLVLFTPYGKFLGRMTGKSKGNILLRKEQYRISDNEERSLEIVKNFIFGKIYNSLQVVDRTIRDYTLRIDVENLSHIKSLLQWDIEQIKTVRTLDELRGIEGIAAQQYFSVFDSLILNQKTNFAFSGRNRRPPLDNVNAMLSFGYTLLANDCANALECVGLDAYSGFMHTDRPGRKSLALDLMEELRAILVDRFVITLINLKQIRPEHFDKFQSGEVLLNDDGRKVFLTEWQKHKTEDLKHPYLQEKVKWGLVPYIQAMLLARYMRDDIDGYPPFLWR